MLRLEVEGETADQTGSPQSPTSSSQAPAPNRSFSHEVPNVLISWWGQYSHDPTISQQCHQLGTNPSTYPAWGDILSPNYSTIFTSTPNVLIPVSLQYVLKLKKLGSSNFAFHSEVVLWRLRSYLSLMEHLPCVWKTLTLTLALKKVLIIVMLQILSYKSRPYYQFSQQRQLDSGRVHWICRSVCIAILTSFKLWTWDAVPVCSFFFHSFHVICGFQCTSWAFPSLKYS